MTKATVNKIITIEPTAPVFTSVESGMTSLSYEDLTYAYRMDESGKPSDSDYLADRYGREKSLRGAANRRWVIPAIVVFTVGGTWLIWSANHYSKPEISSTLIAFSVSKTDSVSLRYYVHTRTPSKSHSCIVTASDYQGNIVGQITDQLPKGHPDLNRTVSIPIRTAAVSASVEHCV